jgi:NADH pyrophosphatase NudC (nudix superfamily)
VREEVGLHLQGLRYLGAFEAIIDHKRDHITVYSGLSTDRRIAIDTTEILEARWFRLQHLPPLGPSAVRILTMWQGAQS